MSISRGLRNCWYIAGRAVDFSGTPHARTILAEPIVFYRKSDGGLCALEDRCAHRIAPLSMGRCEGDDLRCLYHGFKYAPSGQCVEIPGQSKIPERLRVKSYPVHEQGGWSWIWMGQRELADPQLIPPVPDLAEAGWMADTRMLDYAAAADLIGENLLDTSHVGYVHANSGFAELWWTEHRPRVTPLDRGVRVEWWAEELSLADGVSVDQRGVYRYFVPGVMLMNLDNFPRGTARHVRSGGECPAPLAVNIACFAPVPVTAAATRFFIAWAVPDEAGAKERLESTMASVERGFAQDQQMVEAQQRNLERFCGTTMTAFRADEAIIQFQKVCAQLAKAEAQEAG